jgi:hypothetical protein
MLGLIRCFYEHLSGGGIRSRLEPPWGGGRAVMEIGRWNSGSVAASVFLEPDFSTRGRGSVAGLWIEHVKTSLSYGTKVY